MSTAARTAFIKKHAAAVINATAGTGLFPSVKMAQMIIESANKQGVPGEGSTAKRANNYFGIKADKSWNGPRMKFNTPNDVSGGGQPVSFFRVYKNAEESIRDHSAFLAKFKRYKDVFTARTPEQQAKELEKAGYAGIAPNDYAEMIIKMIDRYNLKALDSVTAEKKN